MGSLKSKPLEIVERVVRNMPILGIEYLYEDTEHGPVYIAFGKEAIEDRYHGVWALTGGPGLAQDVQFVEGTRRDQVVEALFTLGRETLASLASRQLLVEGAWRGGK